MNTPSKDKVKDKRREIYIIFHETFGKELDRPIYKKFEDKLSLLLKDYEALIEGRGRDRKKELEISRRLPKPKKIKKEKIKEIIIKTPKPKEDYWD
jgi:uncharacterized membrane protein